VTKLGNALKFAKDASKLATPDNARKFAQHMVPHVVRPAQIIWNQAIGAMFLILAVPALFKAADFYRNLNADPQNPARFGVSLIFGLIMAFFAVVSFLRARRLSRL
jgi:hypothetical protein